MITIGQVAACTLINMGELDDHRGLVPDGLPVEEAAASEGGPDVQHDARGSSVADATNALDVSADTAQADVVHHDAGPDAAPDVFDAGGCKTLSPEPDLCDPFDVTAIDSNWQTVLDDGGFLAVSSVQAKNGPRSLRTQTPPMLAGGDDKHALLRRFYAQTVTRIRYSYDALVVDAPRTTGSKVIYTPIRFTSAPGTVYLDVRLEARRTIGGVYEARVQQSVDTHTTDRFPEKLLADPLPLDRWFHVVVDLDTSTSTVRVTFDGKLEGEMVLDPAFVPGPVEIRVGLRSATGANASGTLDGWTFYFDNVVADFE